MIETIDNAIVDYLDIDTKYQKEIIEAMKYSLFSGGKRLRPLFMLKTFEIFNTDIEKALPYAVAVEMIHTYSLVHDDLPAMDNDDYRRGKLTNHKQFTEGLAILTGDALLNLAYEIMINDISKGIDTTTDFRRKLDALKVISKASGVEGMIGGQVVDISFGEESMDEDALMFMYGAKTGALFRASILSGAIIGGAQKEEIDILEQYSALLGLSYQIQDDLLDLNEDEKIDKITYLSFYNLEKAKKDLSLINMECYKLLNSLKNRDTKFLLQLTKKLINREK